LFIRAVSSPAAGAAGEIGRRQITQEPAAAPDAGRARLRGTFSV